jgi:hypothetical protein
MNAKAIMSDIRRIKIVQVPLETRRNGNVHLNYGEARIHSNRARTQGNLALERIVTHGVPLSSIFETDTGQVVVLEPEYDAVVYLPSRKGMVNDNAYAEDVFLDAAERLFKRLAETSVAAGNAVEVICSTPGTTSNPDKEERDERWAALQEMADGYGLTLTNRFAAADLPSEVRNAQVPVQDDIEVQMDANTLFVVGARNLEGPSERRIAALRGAATQLLDLMQPEHIVTPLAVGFSLALAEVATERGTPVTLVSMNDTINWAPATQARLDAVIDAASVTVTGKAQYELGRIPATVRYLDKLATDAGAKKVIVDEPTGSETSHVTNAISFWNDVKTFLQSAQEQVAEVAAPKPTPVAAIAGFDFD